MAEKEGKKKKESAKVAGEEEERKGNAVVRTVVVPSVRLSYRTYRALAEVEKEYLQMLKELVDFAYANGVISFTRLKAAKYQEMRRKHPDLPSHYVYTVCQDASARVKSFLAKKERGEAYTDRPQVRRVSIWLDDHLWKAEGRTAVRVAVKGGRWVTVELRPHKHFWRHVNGGWIMSHGARFKLDHRRRVVYFYFVFEKAVKPYQPKGYLSVDVNENNVTMLVDGTAYLLETDIKRITLGYAERRKRIQERNDGKLVANLKRKNRVMAKLREGKKKRDIRRKIANIVVQIACQRGYAIVLERLGRNPGRGMIRGVRDPELRHRIYQAAFKGIQREIEEKAREWGVPVLYINPKNTSKVCPIHGTKIKYNSKTRRGKCPVGGEVWHRDVAAVWNLLLRARGDGSTAPSPGPRRGAVRGPAYGSPVPLGSTAAHDPIRLERAVWARRKSLGVITNNHKISRMSA